MPRLSDLVQRRSFGFAGDEGALFDEMDYQNRLSALSNPRTITNDSLGHTPQNYIQRTGGQRIDLGPSMQVGSYGGAQGYRDPQGNVTTYTESGDPVTMSGREISNIKSQAQAEREIRNLQNQAMIKQMQEKAGALNPAEQLARDKFEWEKSGGKSAAKPMPATALKMQNEALDTIGSANSLRSDLLTFKQEIDKGSLPLGPVQNKIYEAQNWAGKSSPESKKYASFKANLERLRNESLRLNKGVQTEGDAIRAWNEVLASINDPELVSDRLEEIANINQRGAQLKKLEVDQIRANYGNDPLDTSSYEKQSSAYDYGNNADSEAIAWAKKNQNDPRAMKILELHGM